MVIKSHIGHLQLCRPDLALTTIYWGKLWETRTWHHVSLYLNQTFMNDHEINKKFATAKGPVNRRLVTPAPVPTAHNALAVQVRLQAMQAKQRLGASLAERLIGAQRRPSAAKALSPVEIMMTLGGAVSAMGLILGVIQSSLLTIGVSALLLCGFGTKAYLALRSRRSTDSAVDAGETKLIESEDIDRLDTAMEKVAIDASQETVDRLSNLKVQIARCVALMTQPDRQQPYSSDDQLFIRECVRRYLPDSISSYFRVPQKDRASLVIEDGKTAIELLHDQLDMLTSQLLTKETRLSQLAGESLMQQQRFLAAKTRSNL